MPTRVSDIILMNKLNKTTAEVQFGNFIVLKLSAVKTSTWIEAKDGKTHQLSQVAKLEKVTKLAL